MASFQVGDDPDPLVNILQSGEVLLQFFNPGCEELNMGFLYLRLLTQLIQEKGFLSDLDVITEEERKRDLKEDEKTGRHSKTFLSKPQTPGAEGGMAEDENIYGIFIHGLFYEAVVD